MGNQPNTGGPNRRIKWLIGIVMGIILILTSIFLASGGMTHIAARPGLFGTRANFFSDLNLIAQIVLLLGLVTGAGFARRGHISTHQYIQTGLVLLNIVLTLFIMVVAYVEYVLPGLPTELSSPHGLVASIHTLLGLLAVLCGIYIVLRMNHLIPKSLRIKGWKNFMRLTLGLYLLVGVIGLGVYYFWYIR